MEVKTQKILHKIIEAFDTYYNELGYYPPIFFDGESYEHINAKAQIEKDEETNRIFLHLIQTDEIEED